MYLASPAYENLFNKNSSHYTNLFRPTKYFLFLVGNPIQTYTRLTELFRSWSGYLLYSFPTEQAFSYFNRDNIKTPARLSKPFPPLVGVTSKFIPDQLSIFYLPSGHRQNVIQTKQQFQNTSRGTNQIPPRLNGNFKTLVGVTTKSHPD